MSEGKDIQHRNWDWDVEVEGMEVDHLIAESGNHPVSVDDFFRADKTPYANNSGYTSCTGRGGDGYEKFNVKLSDTGPGHDDKHYAPMGPPTKDYHIDTEFFGKDSDCEDFHRVRVSIEKSSLETHSSGYSGNESSANGGSESSSTSNGKPQFRNGKYDDKSFCKSHGFSKKKCDCQHQLEKMTEEKSPIIYRSQTHRKLQSRLGLLDGSGTSEMNFTSLSDLHRSSEQASLVSNHEKTDQSMSVTDRIKRLCGSGKDTRVDGSSESSALKRSRKPPIRYIDEFSGSMSFTDEKQSTSDMTRNRTMNVRTSSERDRGNKVLKTFKFAQHEGFYGRSPIKSSITNRNACGLSKEFSPVTALDSDEESDSDGPEVSPARMGSKTCGNRRKCQIIWTLPEVEKLVDGISHYGVGRWTEIQRVFFLTSAYRTPVDLRDKWRNLLKASNAWMQNEREGQKQVESHKNGHRQLPKEILHHISELGRLHPYPVKRNPKHKLALTPMPSSRK